MAEPLNGTGCQAVPHVGGEDQSDGWCGKFVELLAESQAVLVCSSQRNLPVLDPPSSAGAELLGQTTGLAPSPKWMSAKGDFEFPDAFKRKIKVLLQAGSEQRLLLQPAS